ncbi:MAG: hypothetical protein AAB462_01770 [Patescibacteria group bacterium]
MKNKRLDVNQDGIAHLGLLLFMILVFAAIGFAGYRVMYRDADSANTISESSINSATGEEEATAGNSALTSDNLTEENQ